MPERDPDEVPEELRDLTDDDLPEAYDRDKEQRFEHRTHPEPVPEPDDEDDDGAAGSP
ncbi:MAG TPA: hypothetical protein VKA30_02650 [Actinomycetota bacterium]|nr:hypothetical protein [Actinomycetota bacterium]